MIARLMGLMALAASSIGLSQPADGSGESALAYKPFDAGAPAATVGGSIRGAESSLSLTIIAPASLAATANARPTIYWHLSDATILPIEQVLIEEGGETPLAQQTLSEPLAAGVYGFTVPEDVSLQTGQVYQFSVAAVADPEVRSNDVFASTLLIRADIKQPPSSGGTIENALALARLGAWYDTLELLKSSPLPEAKQLWSAMLSQQGLGDIGR